MVNQFFHCITYWIVLYLCLYEPGKSLTSGSTGVLGIAVSPAFFSSWNSSYSLCAVEYKKAYINCVLKGQQNSKCYIYLSAGMVETDPEGALAGFDQVVKMEPEKAEW